MKRRAVIHKIFDNVYCIDDAGDSCCYVVCGNERAAVIDTVNGMEDLRAIVREITDLPLVVINTHGHPDHVFGNTFFDEAFIHPADIALHDYFFADKANIDIEKEVANGESSDDVLKFIKAAPCPLKELNYGDFIELGSTTLEVISLRGHTQGSVGLLDRESGCFFTGDAINRGQYWMQLPESTSLREYAETLQALAPLRPFIKTLHGGHSVEPYKPEYIDIMLNGVNELITSKGANDGTAEWFGGSCPAHRLSEGTDILYTPDKL